MKRQERRIVMIGPGFDEMGGIARVTSIWRENGFLSEQNITYIASVAGQSLAMKIVSLAKGTLAFVFLLRKNRLTYLHSASQTSFYRKTFFACISILFRIPVLLHIHPSAFPEFVKRSAGMRRKYILFVLRHIHYFVVLTDGMKLEIESMLPGRHVFVLHNPVDVSALGSHETRRAASRLLYLGWYLKDKGVYDLVDAIAELANRGVRVGLDFFGTGEASQLRQHVRTKEVEDLVSVHGWLDGRKKTEVLWDCAALVLPSYTEGIPNVILEAMATKTPIISTLVGGLTEVLRDRENAIIVQPGKPTDLANKILECLKDHELREHLTQNAYQEVKANYDVKIVKDEFNSIMQLILDGSDHSRVSLPTVMTDHNEKWVSETIPSRVYVGRALGYDVKNLHAAIPDHIFSQVFPGDTVILKPNWVRESHEHKSGVWEHVITHPAIITTVLHKVLRRLDKKGRVVIVDAPDSGASFDKILSLFPVEAWRKDAKGAGVDLEIVDLRDSEWITRKGLIIKRKALPSDPKGRVEVDLRGNSSEFFGHRRSQRGYYGADYDRKATNCAHDGYHNTYCVSRTVIEGDVFINLPKLKTHRKAGITCCLKNLVGVNTNKNLLPHHSEGGPSEGGDQFPKDSVNSRLEGRLAGLLKQHFLRSTFFALVLSLFSSLGHRIFGETSRVIRSGNWYGNDTIWRMILDLNKVILYANSDGSMREGIAVNTKRYIGIVDAVIAGEGHGPLAPDPVPMGYVVCGTNPVAMDSVCATLMGFDPMKIPAIAHAFDERRFPLCNFEYVDIRVTVDGVTSAVTELPDRDVVYFEPQFGWKGHIERELSSGEGEIHPEPRSELCL